MGSLIIDVETTIFEKGNPFAQRNRLCYVGARNAGDRKGGIVRAYSPALLPDLQRAIDGATTLVGFNFKFDLHWLRREGITFENKRIWDCAVARFLLEAQRVQLRENSLERACEVYQCTPKSKHIEETYWSKGIDTPDIPEGEMLKYQDGDLVSTDEVYHKQLALFQGQPKLYNLFKLHMDDLLVLQEMEFNGLRFNMEKAKAEEERIRKRIEDIEGALRARYPNTPINFDSGDDLSAFLYGGSIVVERKEPVGLFKTGQKVGQVRFKKVEDIHTLTRLLEPLEGSELKKANKEAKTGPWATSEDVLKQLKPKKEEVDLLLERAKLSKLLDYFSGWPALNLQKDWSSDMLHGQFNQTIARTGRLSSSGPNQQNMPDPVLQLVESRYAQVA